jgi:hypothetical protein
MTIIGDLDRPLPQDRVEIHHLCTIVQDTLDSTRCTVVRQLVMYVYTPGSSLLVLTQVFSQHQY